MLKINKDARENDLQFSYLNINFLILLAIN